MVEISTPRMVIALPVSIIALVVGWVYETRLPESEAKANGGTGAD